MVAHLKESFLASARGQEEVFKGTLEGFLTTACILVRLRPCVDLLGRHAQSVGQDCQRVPVLDEGLKESSPAESREERRTERHDLLADRPDLLAEAVHCAACGKCRLLTA